MTPKDPPTLLHEHFEAQAERSPEAVAVLEGTRRLSYGELADRANRVAAGLSREGIEAGSTVGLCMERSIDWVTSILAILKVNAAVVPLPPGYPARRLSEILHHARLDRVLLQDSDALPPSAPGRSLHLEHLLGTPPPQTQLPKGQPHQAAFILSSSGSTGRPKMIVRSHRSFFHRLRWTWQQHPYGPGERCCQKSHMTTTHAIYEVFEPILGGAPVVIISDDAVRDLERFWETIRNEAITRLLIVPSQLQASLTFPDFVPPPLQIMVLMGEYVSPALAEQALAAFPPPARIFSIYGSTEASSALVCDLRKSFRPGSELPLGKPIQTGVEARVLDLSGSEVAPGEHGRLYLGGSNLFTGYLRDPERTTEALVPLPPSNVPFYDTGDDVRVTEDGELEFVGRADNTIKVRGFRVELQEVERALALHPEVRQAVVVAKEDGSGTHRLRAFVSPSGVDPSEIFGALRRHLPEYMIPSLVTGLDRLPLTPSGKVDRQRLLAGGGAPDVPRTPVHRDLSGTEQRISSIWQRLLGTDNILPQASFFEVGGTSLSVLSMVHHIREEFGLERKEFGAGTVYRWPTIEGLGRRIQSLHDTETDVGATSEPVLVTLKRGTDTNQPPLFLIASAGGALGSYEKLTRALSTPREVIGVRDPFLWGDRDPLKGFHHWVDRYLEAIRERQPSGPYFIGAYSSAGAFGLELARRLRAAGQEVGLLTLIDPLGLDRRNRWRFGWWVLRSTYGRLHIPVLTRIAGWVLPRALMRSRFIENLAGMESPLSASHDTVDLAEDERRNKQQVINFSGLLELNTGVQYMLEPSDFEDVPPEGFLDVLLRRVKALTPEADLRTIERIFLQYPMQTRAQNAYQPRSYDGDVLLLEPATRYGGLIRAQLRPYLRHLEAKTLRLGPPSDRVREVSEKLGTLSSHYRSMRDEGFVAAVAREMDERLR